MVLPLLAAVFLAVHFLADQEGRRDLRAAVAADHPCEDGGMAADVTFRSTTTRSTPSSGRS
jgi:hypothetical protein